MQVLRDEAKARGLRFFILEAPCRKGHFSPRYVSTGACKSCSAEDVVQRRNRRKNDPRLVEIDRLQRRARYRQNPEKFRAKSKRYRTENPLSDEQKIRDSERRRESYRQNIEREKISRAEWLKKNRERKVATDAKWQRENPDRVKLRNMKWQQQNANAVRSFTRNYRAKKRAAAGTHNAKDIEIIYRKQDNLCACGCGVSLADGFDVDHIIPVSRGGSNWPSNLQLLTPRCNKSKNARTMEEWIAGKSVIRTAMLMKVRK